MTRTLRILAISLAALAILALILLGVAHTAPVRNWVLSKARWQAPGNFDAAELHYNLLTRDVWLRGVRIGPANAPLATASHVHAVLENLGSVRQAEIDGLHLRIMLDDTGSSTAPERDWRIGQLLVRGGSIRVEHRAKQASATIPIDSLTVSGTPRDFRARLRSSRGGASYRTTAFSLDHFSANLYRKGPSVDVVAEVRSAETSVGLTGAIRDSEQLDLRYTLRSDLARLRPDASGAFTATGKIQGTLANPAVTATADGKSLRAGTFSATGVHADATYSNGRIQIAALRLQSPYGAVTGSAGLALESGTSRASLTVAAVPLETLSKQFGVEPAIASAASGPVTLEWPALDFARASLTADLALQPTRDAASRQAIPAGGHVIARLTPHTTELEFDNLSALGALAQGKAAIAPDRALSGNLTLDIADLATLAPLVPLQGVTGPLRARIELSGAATAPAATIAASSDKLSFGKATGIQASVEGRVSRREVDLTAKAANLPLAAFASSSGNIAAEARIRGSFENPIATVTATAPAIAVSGEPLGELRAQGTLAGRAIKLDSARLTKGEGTVEASGAYQLDTGTYTVDALATRFPVDRAAATARSLELHIAAGRARVKGEIETSLAALAPAQRLEGDVIANVEAEAPIADPEAATATIEIPNLAATWNGHAIRAQGPVLLAFAHRAVTVRQADLRSGDASLQLTGVAPLEGKGLQLEVKSEGKLADLAQFAPGTKLEAEGSFRFEGSVTGSIQNPEPQGVLTVAASTLGPLREVNLAANIRDGIARLDQLTASWASAKLQGTGEIFLPPRKGVSQIHATVDRLDFASIPGMPPSVSGAASIRLDASATSFDLRSLRADLTLPELHVTAGGQRLEQNGPSTVRIENGVATVRQLRLEGTGTSLQVTGAAGIEAPYSLAINAAGSFDAALLTAASQNARAAGITRVSLALRGSAAQPTVTGFIETEDAQFAIADPAIAADNLAFRAEFAGDRIEIPRIQGEVNGGAMRGRGSASIQNGKLAGVNLTATVASAFLEFPRGLKSRANAALALRGDASSLAVTGDVYVMEGSYREPITIERSLFAASASSSSQDLARIRWDVRVRTVSPIAIDNNIARVGVTADLHAIGTPARTGLTGRVDLEEGGEVTLGERKYTIERGAIQFTNEQRIEPVLDLQAKTRVANHDVTLRVEGEPGKKLETAFSSDPPLPEPDVIALVATGRTLEESRGAEADIAKEALLSYLTAGLSGSITGRAQQALGLSQVRIEPSLIAAETEPTARLTLGQDLSRQFGLVYSMNLRDARDQIWVGRYDLGRRFSTRAVRQADNTFRFQFQHDVRFGGKPDPAREPQAFRRAKKIGKIVIETSGALTEKQVASMLGLRAAQDFDFFRLRKGVDRVRAHLRDRGHHEAAVHVDREETETAIDLMVRVKPGPAVRFVFEGLEPSRGVRGQVRDAWSAGVFDGQRVRDASRIIEKGLAADRYLRASLTASVSSRGAEKQVLFEIRPGERSSRVEVRFPGATAIDRRTLRRLASRARSEPEAAVETLRRRYGEEGYLDARVGPRKVEFANGAAAIQFPVEEGPRYRVGAIRFVGATVPQSDLRDAMKLGEIAAATLPEEALTAVRDLYAARGFAEAEVELVQKRDPAGARVDLEFQIREGKQRVLGELRVEGTEHTSPDLVRAQIAIAPGQPLGGADLSRARRNLYSTGAFTLADLETQPAGEAVNLIARVREVRPWELRYGGFFDTDKGPGGILDFANRNMLGSARVIGLRTRYDSQLREARAYFSQPFLRRLPVHTVASGFVRRELDKDFITDRNGLVINEELRWRGIYTLAAGYRFERVHTFEKQPDPVFPFDVRLRVAPVTATFARETRDDLLDATRGSFLSGAWEWGAQPLGGELSFLKYFGQYFRYFPLTKPERVPWAGVWRSRWVYAAGVRVGLSGGLAGQEMVASEQFYAGGGTTVRGFEQNRLGPVEGTRPRGGNAVFVMNHELRFPLWRFVDGVSFVDAGNVYPRIADFRLSDLRTSAGLGVRLRTPYFVLRLDYGAKLDRRAGEGFGRWFFSIGQAF